MPDRRPRPGGTRRQKRAVAERARGRCEYCLSPAAFSSDPFAVEHIFTWSVDLMQIVGRTSTGRATVAQLQLNRHGVINLRRDLRLAGEHPPPETRARS